MAKSKQTVLEAAGREVVITNPDKVFFPRAGRTKLDLAKYYAAVAEGALRGISGRPIVLKRYVHGAESEPIAIPPSSRWSRLPCVSPSAATFRGTSTASPDAGRHPPDPYDPWRGWRAPKTRSSS